jgi:hypothetical protein
MVEIFKSLEQVAVRLSPVVLFVPGLAMVVLGLLAWLAGTCLRRLVLSLFGAGVGALTSLFLETRSPALVAVAVGLGAAFGALLPRVFIAILLSALGTAIAFVILAGAHLLESQGTLFGGPPTEQTEQYTVPQSLEVMRAYSLDVADRVQSAARAITPLRWAILAALGAGLLLLGLFFERLATALTCSVLGTLLIFSGLVLPLMFKGSTPVAHIEQQSGSYGLVLLGMAAFGTLEQLLVCRRPRPETEGEAGKTPSGPGESKRAWRGK